MKATKGGSSILDVEFAEEEDDDEYNPEKDEEVGLMLYQFSILFYSRGTQLFFTLFYNC